MRILLLAIALGGLYLVVFLGVLFFAFYGFVEMQPGVALCALALAAGMIISATLVIRRLMT